MKRFLLRSAALLVGLSLPFLGAAAAFSIPFFILILFGNEDLSGPNMFAVGMMCMLFGIFTGIYGLVFGWILGSRLVKRAGVFVEADV